MTTQFGNRIVASITSTGTGTANLGSAVGTFLPFSALTSGNVVGYAIDDPTNSAWEIGTGVYSSGSPGTLTRNVETSTNSNAAINLSGSAQVAISLTAGQITSAFNDIGRNILHNSMFRVQQRGTGAFTSGVYTADRWLIGVSSSTVSVTIVTLADADRTAIGDESAQYALQNVVGGTSGAGDFAEVIQRVEGVQRISGKTVTLSFWAKANTGTPKLGLSMAQAFGSGGSPSSSVAGIGATNVTLSTTWTRYSVAIAVTSSSGKTFGTTVGTDYTAVNFAQSSGSTNNTALGSPGVQSYTLSLWGIQLEIAAAPTQLEKSDPRYDLSNCQRFYQAYTGAISVGFDSWAAGGFFNGQATYPTQMRATPTTVTLGSTSSPTNFATAQVLNNSAMGFQYQVSSTSSGATAVTIAGYTSSADL